MTTIDVKTVIGNQFPQEHYYLTEVVKELKSWNINEIKELHTELGQCKQTKYIMLLNIEAFVKYTWGAITESELKTTKLINFSCLSL